MIAEEFNGTRESATVDMFAAISLRTSTSPVTRP